jgi:2-keto-4-pentenoate hydratase/2-oxohepta-3-ene-1,7-dioic acid hydratase in catechol pathway
MKSVILDGKKVQPSKIICIGRNYVDHIRELGNEIPREPVIFLKPNSAVADEIRSSDVEEIHYEGELTLLLGAGEPVAVGFGLDLTKRLMQTRLKSKGLPWERAKAFDGAAVFSEFVSYSGPINDLRLELYINGRLAQQGGCELMMHKPDAILQEVKTFLSLEDGDLVMTGTPGGVGPVHRGDTFTGKIFDNSQLIVEASWLVR